MKKFLTFVIVAAMLVTSISVVAFATKPKASDFVANNGFFVFDNENSKWSEERDPATLEDTDKGVKIVHGGYYSTGDNFGGVTSAKKYDLNGFEVTIFFEKMPEVASDTDTWIAVNFLAAQRGFYTNKFDPNNGGNNGIIQLIRWSRPWVEFHGPGSWSTSWQSGNLDASINAMFGLKSGDSLTVKVNRTPLNKYTITYAREGFKDFTVPYEFDIANIVPDGQAYLSITPSCRVTGFDAFTYYITDVRNGTPYTDAELKAIEDAKLAAENAAKRAESVAETDAAKEKADEAMAEAKTSADAAAIAKAYEALDAVTASYKAIADQDWAKAREQSDLALDCVKEVGDLIKAAEERAAEEAAKAEQDAANAENNEDDKTDATEEEAGFPVVPVVIILVVAVAVVVAVVIVKKKK